jgi:hypothetical protein
MRTHIEATAPRVEVFAETFESFWFESLTPSGAVRKVECRCQGLALRHGGAHINFRHSWRAC